MCDFRSDVSINNTVYTKYTVSINYIFLRNATVIVKDSIKTKLLKLKDKKFKITRYTHVRNTYYVF